MLDEGPNDGRAGIGGYCSLPDIIDILKEKLDQDGI